MTTLAALATKDALVMGCDSLGSVTKQFVDPYLFAAKFIDMQHGWKLRLDKDGTPLLKGFREVWELSQSVPYNHMTHVDKLFSLRPLEMGIMTTGIASIGDRTIKSLIGEFKRKERSFKVKPRPTNYTVKSIANKFLSFVRPFYDAQYPQGRLRPGLEFMIGGYDKRQDVPKIYRIYLEDPKIEPTIEDFGVVFGGQMQEIQRIIFGTDTQNKIRIIGRVEQLYELYRTRLQEFLNEKGIKESLPTHEKFNNELQVFKEWDLDGFEANWGDFSDQNAIECVSFFVEIMVKSQQFSSTMPTVGGNVRIGLINKSDGFRFISKEEFEHQGHTTPKEVGNNA
jgi:hypothetical protein